MSSILYQTAMEKSVRWFLDSEIDLAAFQPTAFYESKFSIADSYLIEMENDIAKSESKLQ